MAFDFRTSAPELTSGKEMGTHIENAIKAGKRFYIGAAKQEGTSLESLTNCGIGSKHRMDYKFWRQLYLDELFYTELTSKKNVRKFEERLLQKYKTDEPNDFCLNGRSGGSQQMQTDDGVLYLRVYQELGSIKLITAEEIESEIEKAIKTSSPFYIGAAKRVGTAKESLDHRGKGSGHHKDKDVSERACLMIRFCSHLMSKETVCKLEKRLIKKYRPKETGNEKDREEDTPTKLCLNGKDGESNCITLPQGIVYLRVYRKLAPR